jgi:hypothetical protein
VRWGQRGANRGIAFYHQEHQGHQGSHGTCEAHRDSNGGAQALDRLLDPHRGGLTLDTLERAASAVGKRVRISFEDAAA